MMGPKGCPETSVTNYQSTLPNILEERTSDLHRGGSLKSRKRSYVIKEPDGLSPSLKQPAIGPHLELDESAGHSHSRNEFIAN
jgi:hypothetical protein